MVPVGKTRGRGRKGGEFKAINECEIPSGFKSFSVFAREKRRAKVERAIYVSKQNAKWEMGKA